MNWKIPSLSKSNLSWENLERDFLYLTLNVLESYSNNSCSYPFWGYPSEKNTLSGLINYIFNFADFES